MNLASMDSISSEMDAFKCRSFEASLPVTILSFLFTTATFLSFSKPDDSTPSFLDEVPLVDFIG